MFLRRVSTRSAYGVALLVLLAGAIGSARAGSSSANSSASCVPYIIIDTRGSGEALNTVSPPGAHFIAEWKLLHPGASIVVVKNPYPASGLFSFPGAVIKVPSTYYHSVVQGKDWLTNELVGFAHCSSSTRILLTGYSQGAQVTADVVQKIGPPHVFGVALFGDPYFNSHDSVDRGGFLVGRNGFLGMRPTFSAYWRPHVLSYCHLHDPVCQGALHNVGYGDSRHTNYDKLGEPEEAAKYFASLEPAKPNPVIPSPPPQTSFPTTATIDPTIDQSDIPVDLNSCQVGCQVNSWLNPPPGPGISHPPLLTTVSLAETFTPQRSPLTRLDLVMTVCHLADDGGCNSSSGDTGTVTVLITAVTSDGAPDPARPISTVTFSNQALPLLTAHYQSFTITFTVPPQLVVGKQYAIVLKTNDTESLMQWWGTAQGYAGGQQWMEAPSEPWHGFGDALFFATHYR